MSLSCEYGGPIWLPYSDFSINETKLTYSLLFFLRFLAGINYFVLRTVLCFTLMFLIFMVSLQTFSTAIYAAFFYCEMSGQLKTQKNVFYVCGPHGTAPQYL